LIAGRLPHGFAGEHVEGGDERIAFLVAGDNDFVATEGGRGAFAEAHEHFHFAEVLAPELLAVHVVAIEAAGAEEGPEIGADRIEGHIAEVEQAGEAHHDVEAQGQGGEHCDLEDDFQIEYVPGAQDGHQDHREEDRQAQLDSAVHLEPVDRAGREHEHQEAGDGAGA